MRSSMRQNCQSSSTQPFRPQEPVSWKTIFPWIGVGSNGFGTIQAHHIYCSLCFYYCISSTSDHQRTPALSLRYSQSLFPFFPVLANFQQQNRQHFVMTNMAVATQASRNPMTSREWYWNQVRSWIAGRKCLAPLWRMTNSIQKTALSKGFIG